MLHESIRTLDDLYVVRANMLQYKKDARRRPTAISCDGLRTWSDVYSDYRWMYSIIRSRALAGPVGALP